jgi:hypothetical protein
VQTSYQLDPRMLQIAGRSRQAHPRSVDPVKQLDALERALVRLGIRLLEEELPEEARVDGGLCRVSGELVLYVSPTAPPWRRAGVLLDALRRLPHRDLWLPPEIRRLLQADDFCDKPLCLIGLKEEDEH